MAGLLDARCSVFAVARYPIAFVSTSSFQPRSTLNTSAVDVQMFEESIVGGTIVRSALCALTAYIWACSIGGAQMPVPMMYAESSDGNSATSFQGFRRSR